MNTSVDKNQKAWAWQLRRREESGEVLNGMQRAMWRAALGAEGALQPKKVAAA